MTPTFHMKCYFLPFEKGIAKEKGMENISHGRYNERKIIYIKHKKLNTAPITIQRNPYKL